MKYVSIISCLVKLLYKILLSYFFLFQEGDSDIQVPIGFAQADDKASGTEASWLRYCTMNLYYRLVILR